MRVVAALLAPLLLLLLLLLQAAAVADAHAGRAADGGKKGCVFASLFAGGGAAVASPHDTQRRRLQQSNCGLQFQNQALSFASCKSLASELGTDANMLWTAVPGEGGNTTLRAAIDAAATAGAVDWAALGFNSAPEMQGGSAVVVRTCASCPSGAAVEGYYLPNYNGVEQPARLAILSSAAALSGGRLRAVFEVSLPYASTDLGAVPTLHAAGPVGASGAIRQHSYQFAETLDLSPGLAASLAPALAPAAAAPAGAAPAPQAPVSAAGGAATSPPPTAASAPAPGSSGSGCSLTFAGNNSRLEFAECRPLTTSTSAGSGLRLLWTLAPNPAGNGSLLRGALVSSSASQWAGFGLPDAPNQMVGTTALIMRPCASCASGAAVDRYLLASYQSSDIVAGTGSLTLLDRAAAAPAGGGLQAVFTAALPQSVAELDRPANIIASVGPASSSGALQSHPVSNAFSGTINFAAGTTAGDVSTRAKGAKVVAHAVLMIVGWGLLLPAGVVFARFKGIGGAWFQLHRAFQAVGYAVGVAGAGVGFDLGEPTGTELEGHHRGIGIAVLALLTLNILAIFWRPKPGPTRLRASWNVAHWTIGGVALALAISNVFIGLQVGGERALWSGLYAIGIGLILLLWAGKLALDCGRRPPGRRARARPGKGGPLLPDGAAAAELGMSGGGKPGGAANGNGAAH